MERLVITVAISFLGLTAGDEFCLRESVNMSCSSDEVVVVASAQYGRMRGGRCIRSDVGTIGCFADVAPQLDEVCSGRQRCVFPVANLLQHKPCPDDYTPYLETHHTCLRVSQSRCASTDGMIFLSEQDGFVPLSTHSSKCPWRVKVDPLQTLQFTLFTFGQRRIPSDCPWSVVFNEGGKTTEHPLCHVSSRETAVYTSKSNLVTVRVAYKENIVLPVPYFLKYEAVGCPELRAPGFAWVRQDKTRATVKCNQTEETWFLACSDRRWHGEIGNCSKPVASDFTSEYPLLNASKVTSLPFGFMIAVVIGVLLGIVIGAIPLALVYVCLKRKRRRGQPPSYYVTEDPYYPGIQHTFAESQQASNVYPALLKRTATTTTTHGSTSASPKTQRDGGGGGGRGTTGSECCYGCAETFAAYNTVSATTTALAAQNQWKETATEGGAEKGGRRQIECCRVLECPDVMAHVVTLHGGNQGGQTAEHKPVVGQGHHYESAAFCRAARIVGQLDAANSSTLPAREFAYDGDSLHCYRAAKTDQSKHNVNEDPTTELGDEYRNPVQQPA